MSYTAAQAARLCGCSLGQLEAWRELGLVVPEPVAASGKSAASYGFRDLVALRMVLSLLDAGLPMARIRRAVGELLRAGEDIAALSLIADGDRVYACRDDGQVLDALRHGQLALFVSVDRLADEVAAEVHAFDSDRSAFVDELRTSVPTDVSDAAPEVGAEHPSRTKR